jgi:type IV secretory pathway protease TraF
MKLKKETLANLRRQGIGPAFKGHGGRIVYRREDLDAWHTAHSAWSTVALPRIHLAPVLGVLAGVALLAASCLPKRPLLVWNASVSVPLGLYWIASGVPGLGDLALVQLAGPPATFAHRRGFLPLSAYLLKPVAAVAGDRVCRFGLEVFIRRHSAALARVHDAAMRPMPTWQGCRTLRCGDFFLLGRGAASFDGRYFGVLRAEHVVGHAVRLGD